MKYGETLNKRLLRHLISGELYFYKFFNTFEKYIFRAYNFSVRGKVIQIKLLLGRDLNMNIFSIFSRSEKKTKVKQMMNIKQKNGILSISGVFQKKYYAKELWLVSRYDEKSYKVSEINPTDTFSFEISLLNIFEILNPENGQQYLYDWYFKIRVPFADLGERRKEKGDFELIVNGDGELFADYFIRCGRFQNTKIHGLTFYQHDGNKLINYITTKGNLSIVINGQPDSPTKVQIDRIKNKRNTVKIEGKLFTRNSIIKNGRIVLKGRSTGTELYATTLTLQHLIEQVQLKYGLNRYIYVAEIDLSKINNGYLLEEDVYDVYLLLNLHDNIDSKLIRIGRPTFRAKLSLRELTVKNSEEATIINPYYTFKGSNLSFDVYRYPLETYHLLKKTMKWSWLYRLLNFKKDIWLVGERTYKAQDTGYAFFKYMRKKYPDKNIYYVIEKDSPERENLEPYGNILDYKSDEHIKKTIVAKKIISSHHPDYLYPIRTDKYKKKVKADKIFLQHGVMGTKNMVANYGINAPGFDTDFFIVSSDFEKRMIVNDFGYKPQNVFVTGLSRFDTLFKNDVEKKKQILIIPTWRDWIITDEDFLESEYYTRYNELVNSKQLHDLASKYNFNIVFCLHPNMQKFSSYFENDNVKIINQGEIDVQHLIKESLLMITDYSSVAFDFSFLYKPVIYYQFDRSRFIGKRPSHLDLDNELPGEICFDLNEIIKLVNFYSENGFKMRDNYKKRAQKFLKYRDTNSCGRIYDVIVNNTVKHKLFSQNTQLKLILQGLFKKFRRSKYYFPTMRLFYKLGMKLIPVDKNLILFESGIGKQFGDSPRNIYEEILKQGLKYRKVWVYNRTMRFMDPHTKRIKRLSPQYYFYLLRAGYWVNNQNFPTYIKKRPQTTYLQTWHGTPLKKMLFDIDEVHGRSDDYVERVSNAVKNWDYLISPSPYASKAFRSAFKYKGEILEVGYPRNDIFYNKSIHGDIITRLRNRFHIPNGKKVILYAPTFRDNQTTRKNKFYFDINLDLEKMKEELGDEYVLLLRLHVVINNKVNIDEDLKDFVKNVSDYPDIQELFILSDILITDYSSVMFDFANSRKPILFYTYDLTEYRDNIRGFYIDFEAEAPGPLLFDTDSVIESVKGIDHIVKKFESKYNDFYNKYCSLDDGRASERIVDKVFKKA